MFKKLCILFLICSPAYADDAIRLPRLPAPALPMPAPDTRLTLTGETLYIVDSDVELIVLSSPKGIVSSTTEPGPIRIKGRFADDPTKFQSRTFSGKFVVTIEPIKSGLVELLIVPSGAKTEAEVIRRSLDVQDGTKPQPPPVPPTPKPDPAPIPVAGLRVLIVYEQQAALTAEQNAIVYGKNARNYLSSACVKNGSTPEYRIYDKDIDMSGESQLWKDAMKRDRKSIPWVIISNGVTGFEGPLPASETAFIELVKRYEK